VKLDTLLARGLKAMDLEFPAPIPAQLIAYLQLLEKWNRHYNLTAVRDPEQMVPRHLLDSLSLLPFLKGPRVLDIGTGAGLPGIPLALACPELQFTLLDSNVKKLTFVRQAVHELGLRNIEVVQTRSEKFAPAEKFDTLTARAFSSLEELLTVAAHLCAAGGRILAMKGVYPTEELAAVGDNYRIEVKALTVPGLEAARHLVLLEPR
jgi:16S rRNA (guanine527-N7)-methyltransferase